MIPSGNKIYSCSNCGNQFTYPPATSRSDNHTILCRVCSAAEALNVAGVDEKTADEVIGIVETCEYGSAN